MWYWCEASGLAFLRQTSRRQQQLLRRQRLAVPEETLRGGRAGPPRNQKQQENVPDTNKQQLAATSGHRWDPPSTTHPLAIGSINTLTSPGVILSSDPDKRVTILTEREQSEGLLFVSAPQRACSWLCEHRCRSERSKARQANKSYSSMNKQGSQPGFSKQIRETCGVLWRSISKDFVFKGNVE